MAKRESINKRLSRFSKSSTGSAVLDPDTNILGSEYPYWWKNLENNTIARPSIDSNVLNQTSRHLNSNSQIDTSQAVDEWWKALDLSNTPYSTKRNVKNSDKDSSNNTSTSGSGDEYGVVKKKLHFHANARSNKGNAFSNALNDSVVPSTANLVQGAKCKNPVNDTTSSSRTLTNFEQLDEMRGNNLNQSQSTSDVLKSKPEIFKNDYKSQNRNAFVDVLKNSVEQKSPRKKTSNALINNESRIITSMAAVESLDSAQAGANQFALSFESETNLSCLPAPKAQSTLLEGSTSFVQNSNKNSVSSDIEYEIRKPKSKLITHRCKTTEKNLFENVFQGEEITDKADDGDAITVNDIAVGAVSEESPKQLKATRVAARRTINKHNVDHVDDINESSSNKRSNCVAQSEQDKELSRRNRMIMAFTSATDSSDTSLEYYAVPRLKSKYLMVSNKNQNYNAFQDILVENDKEEKDIVNESLKMLSISQRKTSLRAESDMFESKGVKNISVRESRISSRIQGQSNVYAVEKSPEKALTKTQVVPEVQKAPLTLSQTYLSLHLINDAELEEVENASNRKSGKFSSIVHDKSVLPQMEETELLKIQDVSKRQSGRDSGLQKKTSESEKTEAILEEGNRNLNAALRETASRVAKGDESPTTQDISKRQSGRQFSSQKRSYKQALNESKLGETKGMLERDGKNLSVATRSALPAKEGDASPSTQDVLKSRIDHQSRLQKQSFSRDMMVFESETEDTSERGSRNLSTVSGKLTSHAVEETEALKPQDVLNRQSGRQTRSQKRSYKLVLDESESEAEDTLERESRHLSTVSGKLTSHAVEETEALKPQDILNRQSGRQTRSQKRSHKQVLDESESKGEDISERDNRNSRTVSGKLTSRAVEETETRKPQDVLNRQSGRQTRSQKQSHKQVLDESESKGEDISERDNRNSRTVSGKLTSRAVEETETRKPQDVLNRQSGRQTRSQKRSHKQVLDESESKGEDISERDNRNSRTVSGKLTSRAVEETETRKPQDVLNRQSGRRTRSQKRSHKQVLDESESKAEDISERDNRNSRTVSGKLSSHAVEKTEALKPQDVLNRQSGRQTRSQKRSRLRNLIEFESDETVCIFEQDSKNLGGDEEFLNVLQADETQGTTKSKSDHSRKSEKDLSTPISFESEQDAVVGTMRRKSRRLTKGKTQTASPKKVASSMIDEEGDGFNDASSWKRRKSPPSNLEKQSGRFDKTQASGLALSAVDHPDLEEAQSNTKTQKKQSKMTGPEQGERIVGEIESDEIQDNTSRQTDRLSEPGSNLERIAVNKTNNQIIPETQSLSANIERMRKSGMQCTSDANISTNRDGRNIADVQDKRVNELEASKGVSNTSILLHCSNIGRPTNNARKSLPSTSNTNTFRGQQSIMSFFHAGKPVPASQVFSDEQQMEKLKKELDRVKTCEMDRMMKERSDDKMKSSMQKMRIKRVGKTPRAAGQQTQRANKEVHKAYLVNGQVYKVPRKPRPRYWITNRLYNYLWKRMEPKYNLATRVISEKFVQQLSDVTSVILKRQSYPYYKAELYALMKEMARLGIIHTRNDFYHFCQDFLPHELRVKMVPMLLPGNKRNIPYNMNELHEPILDS